MRKIISNNPGIIAIAALVGVIVLLIFAVGFNFGWFSALVIGVIAAVIAAFVLMFVWPAQKGATGITQATLLSTPKSTASPKAGSDSATTALKSEKTAVTAVKTPKPAADATPVEPVAKVAEPVGPVEKTEPVAVKTSAPAPNAPANAAATAKKTTKPDAKPKKPVAKPKTEKVADKPKAKPVAADGKPDLLTAAREGGPDDLKQIKGVGPKLESVLHAKGIYHFDQVASWRKKEVEWVDANLEGFKGRVTRDEWVKQAKILARGGTTEFSSKVKKGGVY